ncbi:MAG: alpha/beta fold hydrolase [Bacteroidota bacterium]
MSAYKCPWLFQNADLNTVIPNVLRPIRGFAYQRERLELADGDFLDLDWSKTGSNRLAVLIHGLEGSSGSLHVKGMAQQLNQVGWDAVVMNLRSCSGAPNRKVYSYHAGKSDDVLAVLEHVGGAYAKMLLLGFSLGGNLALVTAGRESEALPQNLEAVVAISVPCDLEESSNRWEDHSNLYLKKFMKELKGKVFAKMEHFPELQPLTPKLQVAKTFRDFDDLYTAPIHGFKDATDYYRKSSSIYYLSSIKHPTLLLNALDDPFLSPRCHPTDICAANPHIEFLNPDFGGHIGFAESYWLNRYWHERATLGFLDAHFGSAQ